MAHSVSEDGEPWGFLDAIERAVNRWIDSWSPLPLPVILDDVMLGELDLAIESDLVGAGIVDG